MGNSMKYIVKFNNRQREYSSCTWEDCQQLVINTLSELITSTIGITPTITVIDDYTIIVELDPRDYNKYKLITPINNQYDITNIDWLFITVDTNIGTPTDTIEFGGFNIQEIIELFPEWHKVDI